MVAQESIISIVKEMTGAYDRSPKHATLGRECPMVRQPTIRLKRHSAGTKIF
jgi:hypothetical protein